MSKSHYIIPIFVPHLGCPHNCVFCNQNSITGSVNNVNSDYVKNTVNKYLNTINSKNSIIEISFFGGTFTAIDIKLQSELLAIAQYYKDNKKVQYIRLSTRPDYIDDEILTNLKKYDVDIIELGVQSLDDDVLLSSGRGHNYEDTVRASELIKKYGFTLGHQIMLGLPGDNFEKDINTTKKIIQMNPDICRIYPALVIKNTPMEKMYKEAKYTPYTLNQAVQISKIIYAMLISNNIKVIRIGLQPTEEINVGKEIVAGPFHPAFRELVEGSLLNDMIYNYIKNINCDDIQLSINPKDISKLYCNKKIYYKDMLYKNANKKINVVQEDTVNIGNIIISHGLSNEELNLNVFMDCIQKEIDF